MNTNPAENNEQRSQQQPNAEQDNQTPMSKAVSESDESMDELRKKTDRVKHVEESQDKKDTPWSPGQETSGQ
jgi:hypothetical protein